MQQASLYTGGEIGLVGSKHILGERRSLRGALMASLYTTPFRRMSGLPMPGYVFLEDLHSPQVKAPNCSH